MAVGRTKVMMLAAVSLAGLAGWMAYMWVQNQARAMSKTENTVTLETQPILVAAMDLQYGQTLQVVNVQSAMWPVNLIPAGALVELKDLDGKVVKQDIFRGEPLTSQKIVDHLGGSVLAALVEKNKRAMSVRVDDVVGVAGFIRPGNRVDVLATKNQGDTTRVTTVLEDIKVLAVDQDVTPRKDEPKLVRAVTLEVTTDQAEELVKASNEGKIQLSLRNPVDRDRADKPVAPTKPIVKPVLVHKPAVPIPAMKVQVIRGTEVSEVKPN